MNSLKSIIGLALACLAPVLVSAQEAPKATVTVYGTINVNLQSTEASGATTAANNVKSRLAVSVDSSNIGVRGALKISDMIGGVGQCETSANVDGIGGAGICNRNSRVGLTGAWGTLFYGNWDTPYKTAAYGTKADDPFGNTDVYDAAGIMSSPGFNTKTAAYSTASSTAVTSFVIRAQNAVAYHSPTWNGLNAKLHYTTNEFKNAAGFQNPELYSASLGYDTGKMLPVGISAFAAFEQHKDGFGLVTIGTAGRFGSTAANTAGTAATPLHTTDTGLRFGAGVQFDTAAGVTTVGGVYEMLTYEQSAAVTGALKKYERNAWQVGLKHAIGPHELRARYSVADKGTATIAGGAASNTDKYGASMLALGYGYSFSSQLQAYLYYAQITNEDNAQYTFGTGGAAAVAGATPAGADPSAFGLGFRMAF
ncbi:MAG: porin [Deltaproteobacteria bacterium]|nr:porin [Deltaproteobacteria bacterium]